MAQNYTHSTFKEKKNVDGEGNVQSYNRIDVFLTGLLIVWCKMIMSFSQCLYQKQTNSCQGGLACWANTTSTDGIRVVVVVVVRVGGYGAKSHLPVQTKYTEGDSDSSLHNTQRVCLEKKTPC